MSRQSLSRGGGAASSALPLPTLGPIQTLWTESPWLVRIVLVICALDFAFCATAVTCQAVRARLAERRFRRYLRALQLEADELTAAAALARMVKGEP